MKKNPKYEINNFSLQNIRNTYEIPVINAMKSLLPDFSEFDNCQICIEDIYALSMSRIPPTYVQKGTIVLKKDVDDEDIREVVKYAIQQIISRPKHK